jgi:hypothetical protein
MSDHDTPIETRYPWLGWSDEVKIPEDATTKDYARAYAQMVLISQSQKQKLIEELHKHSKEQSETLEMLRTIRAEMTTQQPMPMWAKVHSAMIMLEALAIAMLLWWRWHP